MYVHESWFCGRVQTQTSDECLPYSWEETEPGAAEDDRSGEGKVLLLLLAGPQLHRQREGNISTHDGGAGWRAWSTGTTRVSERPSLHGIEICFLPFLVYSFILWEYDCFDIFFFSFFSSIGSSPAGKGASMFSAVLQGRDGHPLRKEGRGGGKFAE